MLSILQPEITTLESQVAALQAQIAAAQQRISLLNETEAVAGGSLEALKSAIAKVTALAPSAIANLRAAVLNLFGCDNSSDDGEVVVAIAHQPEALSGQSSEWASPLCCHLEDAPQSSLQGQAVELAQIGFSRHGFKYLDDQSAVETSTADTIGEPNCFSLIPVGNSVAYFRNNETGEIVCCYAGFNNKTKAKQWGEFLAVHHSVAAGFELRQALRLSDFKYEIKLWGLSIGQIQKLAESDLQKSPTTTNHAASKPVEAQLLAPEVEAALAKELKLELAVEPDPQVFQVGSRVEIISDRHGVELVGLTGIVTAATKSGAAVDLNNTLRYFCVDELAAISTPVSHADLDPTEEEKVAIASIQPPAYNLNPQGRGGATANWKARLASGIGVNLKDCGTGGITSLAEWQRIEAEQKAQKALAASTSDTATDNDNE